MKEVERNNKDKIIEKTIINILRQVESLNVGKKRKLLISLRKEESIN